MNLGDIHNLKDRVLKDEQLKLEPEERIFLLQAIDDRLEKTREAGLRTHMHDEDKPCR